MIAEVFAKVVENCTMMARLPGQNVENLDEYGCPKIQDTVGEGKTDSSCNCSSYPFRQKRGFTVPRGKQTCMEDGYATFVILVRVYYICVY